MKIIENSSPGDLLKLQMFTLWNSEYPVQLNYPAAGAFNEYLNRLEEPRHYMILEDQQLKGWAFDFVRSHEKWFGIIIARELQGKHFGSKMLDHLKQQNDELNGWVIDHNRDVKADGSSYLSPAPFYRKNGFRLIPEDRMGFDKISAIRIYWKK